MELLLLIFATLLFSTNNAETVKCVGTDACRNQILSCITPGEVCVFDCDGDGACHSSTLNCIPGQFCTVTCNGWDSCRATTINGQNTLGLFVIGETINQYLHSAMINCPTNNIGMCLVRCEAGVPGGCAWININATQSIQLEVEVSAGGNGILLGAEIYCPLQRHSCHIKILSSLPDTNMISNMNIYAAESFYDVNITCTNSDPTLCNGATLYCTSSYSQQCQLQRDINSISQWNCTNKRFCQDYSYSPTVSPITSYNPTQIPSLNPIISPTSIPTYIPTEIPTSIPTNNPITKQPTNTPSNNPTKYPSTRPTVTPTDIPSFTPSHKPTLTPTNNPIKFNSPTYSPITETPTYSPITKTPSYSPTTKRPTISPTFMPTYSPITSQPTISPTLKPTNNPSYTPTYVPSNNPSKTPTNKPTNNPTLGPTNYPTEISISPTISPTFSPSISPTDSPTAYRDDDKIYDSFFKIKYVIKKLEIIYIEILVQNAVNIVNEMIYLIEESYFETTGLKVRFFSLKIQQLLNYKIQNINYDKYPHFLTSKDEISLNSKIECDEISCQLLLLLNDELKESFEITAQTKLREYFTSYSLNNNVNAAADIIYSQLIFEIGSHGKLESIYISNNKNILEMILYNYVLLIVLTIMFIMSIISFLAFLHTKRIFCVPNGILMDNTLWYAPIFYGLQISVLISDINLFIFLIIDSEFMTDIRITICGFISIIFILIPYGTNLYFSGKFLSMISSQNINAISFFKDNTIIFNILIIISGGCYQVILLLSSSIFGLKLFNSGLLNNELKFMNKIKIFSTIFLQNIPQICIQCVYAASIHGININILFSAIISILSIICTPFVFSNINSKLNYFKYYIKIKLINDTNINDIYDQKTFMINRGKTKQLSQLLCDMYGGSINNIEISRNMTISKDEYSLTYYITHFVNDNIINCNQIIKLYCENDKLLKHKLKQEIFDLNGKCIITFKSIHGIYDIIKQEKEEEEEEEGGGNNEKLLKKLMNEINSSEKDIDGELKGNVELQEIKHETYGNINIEETVSINNNEQIKQTQVIYDQSDDESSDDISFNV